MAWLRNQQTGTVVGPLASDSPAYNDLRKQRDANKRPLWEDQGAQEVQGQLNAAFPAIADVSQVQSLSLIVPALAAAAATETLNVGSVSRAGTVVKATYLPNGAVTGQATNSRTLNVINGGATEAGSAVVASLALVAGTNLAANQENNLNLSNVAVNAGDQLQWQSVLVGTGLADPGGVAVVYIALAG